MVRHLIKTHQKKKKGNVFVETVDIFRLVFYPLTPLKPITCHFAVHNLQVKKRMWFRVFENADEIRDATRWCITFAMEWNAINVTIHDEWWPFNHITYSCILRINFGKFISALQRCTWTEMQIRLITSLWTGANSTKYDKLCLRLVEEVDRYYLWEFAHLRDYAKILTYYQRLKWQAELRCGIGRGRH